MTFEELSLSEPVLRSLRDLDFKEPTNVQQVTIPMVQAGQDLLVQSRTGTGKTAAFGIPIVNDLVDPDRSCLQAMIIAPTRELASQSAKVIESIGKHLGVEVLAIYGGVGIGAQISALQQGVQVVSGTPGRILDHLHRGTMDVSQVRMLVLDEADEMLSMGFIEDIIEIAETIPQDRQTLLFSATVDNDIQRIAQRICREMQVVSLSSDSVGAKGIRHLTYFVSGRGKPEDFLKILEVENPETAIVFCNTKNQTEKLAKTLQQEGYKADWLNGDLPQKERENILRRTRSGQLRLLVATDVAARGIDISHLTHVINYDFPESADQYVHRTGRTGRAGRTGTAISLVSAKDLGSLYYLRLLHGISPIERSLPTQGAQRARREVDRVMLLRQGHQGTPSDLDLAVARRLLTTADADRVIANMISVFFGAKEDVDEEAAEARKQQVPVGHNDQPEPRQPAARKERDVRKQVRTGDASHPNATGRARAVSKSTSSSSVTSPAVEHKADKTAKEPLSEHKRSALVPHRGRSDEATKDVNAAPFQQDEIIMLYINLGKRDGADQQGITALLRQHGLQSEGDLRRIRVRDRYTFVDLVPAAATSVIDKLGGKVAYGKNCVVERAKSV